MNRKVIIKEEEEEEGEKDDSPQRLRLRGEHIPQRRPLTML